MWWFIRDPSTGTLLYVCAHVADVGCRSVTPERDPTGRITGWQDPDGARVRFGYRTSTGNLVLTRTDRRGTATRFEYDGGRLAAVLRWASPDTARVHILSTTYEHDLAGRKKTETDGFSTNRYGYDHAGI